MAEIKKAIILAGGLSNRFLPLSKAITRELLPLVDKPIIHYLLQELKASGITQVVFVLNPEKEHILSYFEKNLKLEKDLKKEKQDELLLELENLKELQKGLSISFVFQDKPLGDGNAILQAKSKIGKEPFVVLFCDVIVESRTPCTLQLLRVFKTCQRPIIALSRVPKHRASFFEIAAVEKIANRLFKVKRIVEKPLPGKEPSDLAVIGKYVLTSEIFDYLKNQKPNAKGKIILVDALESLLQDGKIIYGREIDGKWLPCGNKLDWLKSHFWLCLKDSNFGPEIKKYLKEII